jgi:hypothetical protein
MIIDELDMGRDLAEMDGEAELHFPDVPSQAFAEVPDDVFMGVTEDDISAFLQGY